MRCTIHRSSRKDFTYVYLREGFPFDELPAALRAAFGEPELVIGLELSPQRKLANEDVFKVMANLESQGFHLQLPPNEDITGLLELPKKEKKLI